MPDEDQPASTLTIVAPTGLWSFPDLTEVWRGRALIGVLARREVAIRYASTGLGVAWVLVSPLALVAAFSIGFGAVAGVQAPGGTPYWLWAWAGVLGWQCFSVPLTRGSAALVENERLLGRIYLPRLALPIATITAGLIDIVISAIALLIALACTGHLSGLRLVFLPFALAPALILGTAGGIALSALNARYRDLRHALPVLIQLLLLLCPVGYPAQAGQGLAQTILIFNPLSPALDLIRWTLLPGLTSPTPIAIVGSITTGVLTLFLGSLIFRHHERTLVDRM